MFKRIVTALITLSLLLGLNSGITASAAGQSLPGASLPGTKTDTSATPKPTAEPVKVPETDNTDQAAGEEKTEDKTEDKAETAQPPQPSAAPAAKTETAEKAYKSYLSLFEAMGVSLPDSGAETKITRTDFAKMLYTFLGAEADLSTLRAKEVFDDVKASNKDGGYIVYAYEKGLMRAREGKSFAPDKPVTLEEAAYAAVRILGYHDYFMLEDNHDYGDEYSIANSEGLLKGISINECSDGLNTEACITLLYNIANSPVAEKVYQTTKASAKMGELYMTKYFDVEYTTGIMYSDGVTSIKNNVSENTVTIGTTAFEACLTSVDGFIGKRVTAYYKNDDGDKTLIRIFEYKNDVFTLTSNEITDFKDFVYYYETSNGLIKSKRLQKSITTVYNGSAVDAATAAKVNYKPQNGRIELIDNDKNGSYDVLVIYDYKYYNVGEVNLKEEKILSKLTGDVISYGDSKYKAVEWLDSEGNAITPENVTAGMSIAVLESLAGDRMTIYAYTKSVSGRVAAVNKNTGAATVKINGTVYDIPKAKASKLTNVKIGQNAVLYLDLDGNVFDFKIGEDSAYTTVYLIKAYYGEDNESMYFRYYDSTAAAIKSAELNEKVSIDGTSYDDTSLYESKFYDSATRKTSYQLMRIKLNAEGKISKIDLADTSKNVLSEAEGDLQSYYITPIENASTGAKKGIYTVSNGFALLDKSESSNGNETYKLVGLAKSDLPVICVPANRRDESSYSMRTFSQFSDTNIIDFYKISSEGLYPDIAVYYGGNGAPEEGSTAGVNHTDDIRQSTPVSAVIEVNEVLNETDETVTELTLMTEGKREVLEVYDNQLATVTVPVKQGELIRYCVNGSGKIWGIERAITVDDLNKKTGVLAPGTYNHLLPEYSLTLFNVYYKSEDAIIVTLKEPKDLNMTTLQLPSQAQIYNVSAFKNVFYFDKKAGDFVPADETYIKDYIKYADNKSKVAVRTKNGGYVDMYIYDSDALK